jgi:hypothetical protein
MCGEYRMDTTDLAHISCTGKTPIQLGFKHSQVTHFVTPDYYSKCYALTKVDKDLDVKEVQKLFRYAYYDTDKSDFASMAGRRHSYPLLH